MDDLQLDPYLGLGLLANPFAADSRGDVGGAVFVERGLRPPQPGEVVELVGPSGAGKSTHLHRWLHLLGGGVYHYVQPRRRDRSRLPREGVVAWDECDRMPDRAVRAAARGARDNGATVVIGTHRSSGAADRSNRMPALDLMAATAFVRQRVAAVTAAEAAPVAGRVLPDEAELRALVTAAAGCWWTLGTLLHERTASLAAAPAAVPRWGAVTIGRAAAGRGARPRRVTRDRLVVRP